MELDVVVVGAGQGGLSASYFLRRFGLDHAVLDAYEGPGGAWRQRSPSLTLEKVHGIFALPGMPFEPTDTDQRRPVADVVPGYYGDYERRFGLPVERPVTVTSVTDAGSGLLVATADGRELSTRALVNASGTWTKPHWPYYPGAAEFHGRQLHYADYSGPADLAGKRVAVVGGGHSALHVLSEASGATSVTWYTRREPVFRDTEFTAEEGRRVVALVDERVRAGLPPESVVRATGIPRTSVVRQALEAGTLRRLPMFARVDDLDVDVIVWCTGFRSALDHLAPLHLREPGGGIRMDGTRVVADPRIHLVGYGPSASTIGANRAGRTAAREIRDLLSASTATAA